MNTIPANFLRGFRGFRPSMPQLEPQQYVHPAIPKISVMPELLNNVVAARQIQRAGALAAAGIDVAKGSRSDATIVGQVEVDDLLDIEHDLYLNPAETLRRHFRMYLCPGVIAGGIMTFTPQRRCVPIRLCIPSGTAGLVTGLQSGVEQYYAAAGSVAAACYSELAQQTGWLRPIVTEVGNTITATTTVANGQAVGMWCFDLSEKGLLAPPLGKPRALGFVQVIPATGNANIVLTPQKDFRIRRPAFDETVANYGSLTITALTVANDPQMEATGILPVQMFSTKALDAMIDGDLCKVGAQIVVTVANSNAAAVTAQGEVWGDSSE